MTVSFVDIEGAVVQEYLRYRLSACSHEVAIEMVMTQIAGRGIPALCALVTSRDFPPQNESLDFMQRLESTYQHGLKRAPTRTHIDVVGNVVWMQEYLRYRASGCSYDEARWNVATQIFGGGVAETCGAESIAARRHR